MAKIIALTQNSPALAERLRERGYKVLDALEARYAAAAVDAWLYTSYRPAYSDILACEDLPHLSLGSNCNSWRMEPAMINITGLSFEEVLFKLRGTNL